MIHSLPALPSLYTGGIQQVLAHVGADFCGIVSVDRRYLKAACYPERADNYFDRALDSGKPGFLRLEEVGVEHSSEHGCDVVARIEVIPFG